MESFNDLSVDIPPADWEKRKQARRQLQQPQLHAAPADSHKSPQAQADARKSASEKKDKMQEEEAAAEEEEEHPLKVRSRDRAAAHAMGGGEMGVGGALGVIANLAGGSER